MKGDADLEHGKTFSDTWKLDLLGMEPDLPEAGPPWPNWEKVKKAGVAPSERSGFSMVAHPGKGRSFFFGGVKDHGECGRGWQVACSSRGLTRTRARARAQRSRTARP